jgi:hypothetical protein
MAIKESVAAVVKRAGDLGLDENAQRNLQNAGQDVILRYQIVVDISDLAPEAKVVPVICGPETTVTFLLDFVFFSLGGSVPNFSYGHEWFLFDKDRGILLTDIGSKYARQYLDESRDNRLLSEVGIFPGTSLEALGGASVRRRMLSTTASRQKEIHLTLRNAVDGSRFEVRARPGISVRQMVEESGLAPNVNELSILDKNGHVVDSDEISIHANSVLTVGVGGGIAGG